MIHYTCDRCKRQIDIDEETRFIVHIEIQSATEGPTDAIDEDIDHLTELHELLESLHDESIQDPLSDLHHPADLGVQASIDSGDESDGDHRVRYDLCPECHHQFLRNPLGRDAVLALGFSNN